MSFKDFTANIRSTREYKEVVLEEAKLQDIKTYLDVINNIVGREKGFSFVLLENGAEVAKALEGVGGYSGLMIKSPHYIGLSITIEGAETEFTSAYYMQGTVKKLYDMGLGSCWIGTRGIPQELKAALLQGQGGNLNYLLAFGLAEDKAKSHMAVINDAASYKQDPYGTKVVESSATEDVRLSLGEMVYLYDWGKGAGYEDLERRGVADIFFFVRNAPSYKNMQPCRIILKDGEADLAVVNPENIENYVDAGIMMYTLEGLAKDMGIPCKWSFVQDAAGNKEYGIAAKIEL